MDDGIRMMRSLSFNMDWSRWLRLIFEAVFWPIVRETRWCMKGAWHTFSLHPVSGLRARTHKWRLTSVTIVFSVCPSLSVLSFLCCLSFCQTFQHIEFIKYRFKMDSKCRCEANEKSISFHQKSGSVHVRWSQQAKVSKPADQALKKAQKYTNWSGTRNIRTPGVHCHGNKMIWGGLQMRYKV